MILKNKKVIAWTASVVSVAGIALGIALPLTINKTNHGHGVQKHYVDEALEHVIEAETAEEAEKDFEIIFVDEAESKAVADSVANYIFNNKDKKDFATVSRIVDGVENTLLLIKDKDKTLTTTVEGASWEIKEANKFNADAGILFELINGTIYCSMKIIGDLPTEVIELQDKGQISLYKSLYNIQGKVLKPEVLKTITQDGKLLPSQMKKENLLKNPLLFNQQFETFIYEALYRNDEERFLFKIFESMSSSSSIDISFDFLGLSGSFEIKGFRDQNLETPLETVEKWEKKFNNLIVKDYTLDKLPKNGAVTLEGINKTLVNPVSIPTESDNVEINIEVVSFGETSKTFKVTITSKIDPQISMMKIFTLKDFVKQEDLDVKKEVTTEIVKAKINDLLKNKYGITDLASIDADDALKLLKDGKDKPHIDILISQNRTVEVILDTLILNHPDGSFKCSFLVKKDGSLTNKINSKLMIDYKNKTLIEIDGFKKHQTDQELKNEAEGILWSINGPINVPNVTEQDPPQAGDVSDLIKNAFMEAYGNKITAEANQPTFEYVVNNLKEGTVTYKITYSFGTINVYKNIVFTGFRTASDKTADLYMNDMLQFRSQVPKSISVANKPSLTFVAAERESLNSLFRHNGVIVRIPDKIAGVERKYEIVKDDVLGTATVTVHWENGNWQEEYSFVITGFNTLKDDANKVIQSDFAQFTKFNFSGDENGINIYKQDQSIDLSTIEKLLAKDEKFPPVNGEVKRIYKVISKENSPKLEIEITISKEHGDDKTFTISINGLKSQADFDSNNLKDEVNKKLVDQYKPNGKDADKAGLSVGQKIVLKDVLVNLSSFDVEIQITNINKYSGEIEYSYSATAKGLNITIDNKLGILDGFNEQLTNDQKKDLVQKELDALPDQINANMPNTLSTDLSLDDIRIILNNYIATLYNGSFNIEDRIDKNGTITFTINVKFDTKIASKKIEIIGFKTDEQIQKERNLEDVNYVKNLIPSEFDLIASNAKGVAPTNGKYLLDKQKMNDWKWNMPEDLRGVKVEYSHNGIKENGQLQITIFISKGDTTAKVSVLKNVIANITGINERKQVVLDKMAIDEVTMDYITNIFDELLLKDRLASDKYNSSKPSINETSRGASIVVTEWTVNEHDGTIKWTIDISKGTSNKVLTGIINGFKKSIDMPSSSSITGVYAEDDGVTLMGGVAPAHTTITSLGTIQQGEIRTTITLSADEGYLFEDGKSTITISNVIVKQDKYSLKDAKLDRLLSIVRYKNSLGPVQALTEGAPKIDPKLNAAWEHILLEMTPTINSAKNFDELNKYTENLKRNILDAFNNLTNAIKDSNNVYSLSKIISKLKISDHQVDILKTNGRQPLTAEVLKSWKIQLEGIFPPLLHNAKVEYELDKTIQVGELGVIKVYISLNGVNMEFNLVVS